MRRSFAILVTIALFAACPPGAPGQQRFDGCEEAESTTYTVSFDSPTPPTTGASDLPDDSAQRYLRVLVFAICYAAAVAFLYERGILPPLFVTIPATSTEPVDQPTTRASPPPPPPPQFTSPPDPYTGLPPDKVDRLRALDREREQAIDILRASSLDAVAKQYAINEIIAEYQARTAQILRE